ncbi:MAG: DMT family transporter [Paracoccaceae bacterium]|jgi:drug/metabolite transporter (DMT)-like permease
MSTQNIPKAVAYMTGAIGSFSAMAVAGREVSFELDTFEIMMYRSFVGIAVVLVLGWYFGTLRHITRRHVGTHFTRNLAHFTGQNLWFYAVTVIPLTQLFALEFTNPLWVLLLSPMVLGERLTRMRVLAAVMGFAGILIITRPWEFGISFGVTTAALSAVAFAWTTLMTKKLTRTESVTCVLFYLTVMQAVFGVVCAGYDGDIAVPSMTALPYVMVIALCGLLAHFCITSALALAPATVVIPVDFARLPVIAVIGMLAYGEALDIMVLAGAVLIFVGNYSNILHETRGQS